MIVKYLYVSHFKWKDTFHQVNYEGHPMENKVYRSVYHPDSKVYSLIFREKTYPYEAIVFDDLTLDTPVCTCDISLLTKENLLNHNLEETELDKIIKWMENDNEDIKPKRQETLPVPLSDFFSAIKKQSDDDKRLFREMAQSFEELNLHNTIYCELVIELVKRLKDYSIDTVNDPASELELDADRGLSVNIARAMRDLRQYSLPVRSGGEVIEDLNDCLLAIFREKERLVLNRIL